MLFKSKKNWRKHDFQGSSVLKNVQPFHGAQMFWFHSFWAKKAAKDLNQTAMWEADAIRNLYSPVIPDHYSGLRQLLLYPVGIHLRKRLLSSVICIELIRISKEQEMAIEAK